MGTFISDVTQKWTVFEPLRISYGELQRESRDVTRLLKPPLPLVTLLSHIFWNPPPFLRDIIYERLKLTKWKIERNLDDALNLFNFFDVWSKTENAIEN